MKTLSQNHGHRIMKTGEAVRRHFPDRAPAECGARRSRRREQRSSKVFGWQLTGTRFCGLKAALRAAGWRSTLVFGFMILCAMILCEVPALAEEQTGTYRLIGLSGAERAADLREVLAKVPDVTIVNLDATKSEVTLRYEVEKLFPTAKSKQPPAPEKITERLSSLIGQASKNTFTVAARSTVPADKLTKVEIPIGVLDCKGCRYAAYQAVAKIEGVERATVSATPSAVIAWIDATKTRREALEDALKKARVELLPKP